MSFRWFDFKEARRAVRRYGELLHEIKATESGDENHIVSLKSQLEEQRKDCQKWLEEVRHILDRYTRSYVDARSTGHDLTRPDVKAGDFAYAIEDLQQDIREMEHELAEIEKLRSGLELPPEEEKPISIWCESLQRAISEIHEGLRRRGVGQSPADDVPNRIQRMIQTEASLRQRCEEDVRQYPEQEDVIRRSYRRAIDALREEL